VIQDRVLSHMSGRLMAGVVLIGIISGLFFLKASAADLDRDSIGNLIQKRDKVLKTLKVPSNNYEKKAGEKASNIVEKIYSDDFQKQLQTQIEKLKSTIFKDHADSFATRTGPSGDKGKAVSGGLLPDERLYVFVSSSVPVQTLRNYAAAIDKIGDPRIVMVMRGFVGGMKDWRAMLDFSSSVLVKNPSCDAGKEQCDMYAANLQVDPLLFRRYNVALVPTLVYARGVNRTDPTMSEGLSDIARVSGFYLVQGDVSLEYILETIRRETVSASIDAVLAALRRSYYDGE
jgi:type-F conjugative transfer system pilin assembly protein TrbC